MKSLKQKLIITNILLVISVLLLIGTTVAYFTDKAQITNTLTTGDVKIVLTEAEVKPDGKGNLIEDTSKMRFRGTEGEAINHYGTVYPGQSIYKDPKIENISSNKAWIAAKVVLDDGGGDLHKVIGYSANSNVDIEMLLGGALLDERITVGEWNGLQKVCFNDRYAMVQVAKPGENKYEFYFFFENAFESRHEETLFDTLYFDELWDNSDMNELRDLKIQVLAYGVQYTGFDSCFDAMKAAFPTHFNF